MTSFIKNSKLVIVLLHFLVLSFSVFAQNETENNSTSGIGPFTSKFQIPPGWKMGNDALSKASALYEREGMTSKINFAMTYGQDGILIASWRDFTYPVAAEVSQLTNEIPPLPGIKKSDIKMSVEVALNSDRFEYAFFKGIGPGDNLTITGKGKSRYTGYWVHMPIQYKDSKGNLLSGMLSIFARSSESQTNKLKIDSIINNFISSLDFDAEFRKISFDTHKREVVEAIIRKKIASENSTASKNTQSETTNGSQQSSVTQPIIKDIYMVDNEGKCYRFIDKEGLKITSCPDHSAKPK